jgi:hypothetical protein
MSKNYMNEHYNLVEEGCKYKANCQRTCDGNCADDPTRNTNVTSTAIKTPVKKELSETEVKLEKARKQAEDITGLKDYFAFTLELVKSKYADDRKLEGIIEDVSFTIHDTFEDNIREVEETIEELEEEVNEEAEEHNDYSGRIKFDYNDDDEDEEEDDEDYEDDDDYDDDEDYR